MRFFDQDTACRIALVGPGGIGKTSAGLHIFHHPEVVHRFEHYRYFIACDAITTSDALATTILQVVGAQVVNGENPNTTLYRVLMTLPPSLIFLDNFETPWDQESSRLGVEDILSKIGASPKISLIVTTRIKGLPSNFSWTYKAEIAPLSPEAAKQTYLAIDSSRGDMDDDSLKTLDELLKELDYVPLAIRLLATVGSGLSLTYLLGQWREERTELLDSESRKDRQGSIAVSISISLSQLKITNNPEALHLLGVLSLLPDGLSSWTERISQIGPGFTRVHHLARVLLQTSLCFLQGETLKILSPIRHYILLHSPAATRHVSDLEHYYWNLIRDHSRTKLGPGFPEARKILDPEMGNIRSLIKNSIRDHPSLDVVEVTIHLSWYLVMTIPSTELLMVIGEQTKYLGDISTEARRLEVLGETLRLHSRYVESSECLKEARDKFVESQDVIGAARCSMTLGDNLYLQCQYDEATAVLKGARANFIEVGSAFYAAQCSQRLGDILRVQSRNDEATAVLEEAQVQFTEIGNIFGAAQCSQSIGDILSMQGRYDEATDVLQEAREKFVEIGSALGAAQCSRSLGNILTMQNRYDEATDVLQGARAKFIEIGNDLGVAQCSLSVGRILCMQSQHDKATTVLKEARVKFIELGDVLGAARCLQTLGKFRSYQGDHAEASIILSEAREQFIKIGNPLGAAQCLQALGDNIGFEEKYMEAKELLTQARDEFLSIGDSPGAERCESSLSKVVIASSSDEGSREMQK